MATTEEPSVDLDLDDVLNELDLILHIQESSQEQQQLNDSGPPPSPLTPNSPSIDKKPPPPIMSSKPSLKAININRLSKIDNSPREKSVTNNSNHKGELPEPQGVSITKDRQRCSEDNSLPGGVASLRARFSTPPQETMPEEVGQKRFSTMNRNPPAVSLTPAPRLIQESGVRPNYQSCQNEKRVSSNSSSQYDELPLENEDYYNLPNERTSNKGLSMTLSEEDYDSVDPPQRLSQACSDYTELPTIERPASQFSDDYSIPEAAAQPVKKVPNLSTKPSMSRKPIGGIQVMPSLGAAQLKNTSSSSISLSPVKTPPMNQHRSLLSDSLMLKHRPSLTQPMSQHRQSLTPPMSKAPMRLMKNDLGVVVSSAPVSPATKSAHAHNLSPMMIPRVPLLRSASAAVVSVPQNHLKRHETVSERDGRPLNAQNDRDSDIYEDIGQPIENMKKHNIKRAGSVDFRMLSDTGIYTTEDKVEFLRQTSSKLSIEANVKKVIINMYNQDDSYKTIIVEETMMARDVCQLLIIKNHVTRGMSWQLVEQLVDEKLEREIEDHEHVTRIYESWPMNTNYRFLFRQNFKKYEVFQNPSLYLPGYNNSGDDMVDKPSKDRNQQSKDRAQQAKEALMNEMFMSSDKIAELSGHLWVREPGRKWRNLFCFLRRSGLYFSTRGDSKDPKYWYILCDFREFNIYTATDPTDMKKTYNAPTSELMVFKTPSSTAPPKELVCISCLDRTNQLAWQQGIRLCKFGVQEVRRDYQIALHRHEKLKQIVLGQETPSPQPQNQSFEFDNYFETTSDDINEQNWFHGEMSKDAANKELLSSKSGGDGKFLVRMFNKAFFVSMKSGTKVIHFQVESVPLAGKSFFTLEAGLRNFPDIVALVEHYTRHQGRLPCCLQTPILRSMS